VTWWMKLLRPIAWQLFRRSSGWYYLNGYLTAKGYTLIDDRAWENDTYCIEATGFWSCTGCHVFLVSDGKHVGWTAMEGLDILDEGIGL
jgi:hypothetical protein